MRFHSHVRAIQTILGLAVLVAPDTITAGEIEGGLSTGPDITIINLSGVSNFTDGGTASACPAGYSGTCRGYSLGTNSCNVGSVPIDWCDQTTDCRVTTDGFHPIIATTSDHPVVAQNLFRLKNGRFEQIGLSFLRHGFDSTNSSDTDCAWNDNGVPNTGCVAPPAGSNQLGLGCTNFSTAGLNGARPLSRRSDVQVAGADDPPTAAGGETNDAYDQRILVAEEDLDPAANAGALYLMEGHYVVRDDARAANGLNNVSYRAATVGPMPDLDINLTGSTIRELPAIFGWQVADPEVEIAQADRLTSFTGEAADLPANGQTHPDYMVIERFHAARRVTPNASEGLSHHYEYAIYNMSSDTSADGFIIEFPAQATLANVGFHDIDHHSGEPYDTSDWTIDVDGPNGHITWSAVDAGTNTNALRWGTAFSFWFDSDTPPTGHMLDLFKIDELLDVPFNTPPKVTIVSPLPNASFAKGTLIPFAGFADDEKDDIGGLTTALNWSSTLEGNLGSGGSFSDSFTLAGTYTITANVTDSGGLMGSDEVTIAITDPEELFSLIPETHILHQADSPVPKGMTSLESADLELEVSAPQFVCPGTMGLVVKVTNLSVKNAKMVKVCTQLHDTSDCDSPSGSSADTLFGTGPQSLGDSAPFTNLGESVGPGPTVMFVSTSGCDNDPDGWPTCDLGGVAGGTYEDFTMTVMVSGEGDMTNSAFVQSATSDPDTDNNCDSATTTVGGDIFVDGFESGDTTAWSSTTPISTF